jgi:putative membrane protein
MKRNRSSMLVCVIALVLSWGRGAGAAGTLDDATILAVFDQANSVDVFVGRLGAKYGASEDVRALGRMVAADHVAVQQMGRDLAKKINVVPTPPDDDASVAEYARTVAVLQSKKGADFDKAYLEHELAFHASVIDAIRTTLLPAIRNDELRVLLIAVLPGFERHLAATKAVARKMGVL